MQNPKFRKLTADELEARVATVTPKGCSVLIYKNARVDMAVLDETVGAMNWQRQHREEKGNLFCGIGIRNDESGEWVWKWDCGTESYTEKEKGEASDSFKRAGFCWGIGRELYTCPFIWFRAGDVNLEERNGKPTTRDHFEVRAIEYEGNKVSYLVVEDTKTKKQFSWGMPAKTVTNVEGTIGDTPSAVEDIKNVIETLNRLGATAFMDELRQTYGIKRIEDIKKVDYRPIKELARQKYNLLTGKNE